MEAVAKSFCESQTKIRFSTKHCRNQMMRNNQNHIGFHSPKRNFYFLFGENKTSHEETVPQTVEIKLSSITTI